MDDYVFEWNASLGGIYVDGARGVVVDSNDNVYLAGYQDISGSNTNRDIVIAKYNSIGEQTWVRHWGGINDDIAYDLSIDSFDNIFIVGLTKSFDDVDGDAIILKYNVSGHLQWNITWGGSQFDTATSIDIDSTHNFYIGGLSQSFGDTDGDAFLVKFDSNWVEQWNTTWGGSDTEEVGCVHVDNNDNIYISGRSDSLDPTPAEGDAYLNKYNISGDLLWTRSWGGSYTQGASGIATDSQDGVYIVCMTFGHPASSGKGAIVKYNSEGIYQWEEIWGVNGVYANYMYRIIIDSNDDLYISGTTRSYGLPNNNDAILFNYDTNGNQNWYKIWSEYEWDLSFGLCMDSYSNIYLVGDTKSYTIGENDILLLKYAFVNNTRVITINTPENKTYTEPMKGYFPATHGFENELEGTSGTAIKFVDYTTISSNCEVEIYDEYQGHKKVLRLHDGNTLGGARAQHNLLSTHTTGSIEWWWLAPTSGANGMAFHLHEGIMGTHAGRLLIRNGYFEDMEDNIIQAYTTNRWYHHKIVFNTLSDTYDWYLDGILVVNGGDFENPVANIGSINIKGGWNSIGSCFIDAIGFSWDSDYSVGDNEDEGLLLSYTNTTNLDWIAYSLDEGPNITIIGNNVITLPENGIHSIIIKGITSIGTFTESNLQTFTIDILPEPPTIQGFGRLIPLLLNSLGFGAIVLLGISLFLFIKHNKPQRNSRDN
ncbi:MAG: hypothetical protein ACFE96_05170 [Candidatus Hermodarchaeota archaeon]